MGEGSGAGRDLSNRICPPTPQTSSQSSVATSSSLLEIAIGRPPPKTPTSNFSIQEPEYPTSSSDSDGDSSVEWNREDICPLAFSGDGGDGASHVRGVLNDSRNLSGGSSQSSDGNIFDDNGVAISADIRRRCRVLEGRIDNDGPKDVVMCVFWASERFAASHYDLETGQLSILPDILDSPPDFNVLRSAYNQIRPSFVLMSKNSDERFQRVVRELTGHALMQTSSQDDNNNNGDGLNINNVAESLTDGVSLHPLASREFTPDACKKRVENIKLPYEPKCNGEKEHLMFIMSLIPFGCHNLIRTMGCLLNFLDKSAIELFQIELTCGQIPVVDIQMLSMDELILVDDSAWRSLQIFNTDIHPSTFKQGGNVSASKEGLSVFSFLNQCVTVQGTKKLRNMLLRPLRIANSLQRRYDVIDFCSNTENVEFVRSVTESLKSVKNIPKLLYRLSLLHATVREWKDMYNSLYHCLLIGQMCESIRMAPGVIQDIGNREFRDLLRSLTQETLQNIDFEQSFNSNRIVARCGIDENLDKRKRQYACLPEIMSIVASEEMGQMPTYVTQCCAVYIPEVGYLLAVNLWQQNLRDDELLIPNLDFKFRTQELAYYKTARMRELDVVLGDCSISILEIETLIMVKLAQTILAKSSVLLKISDLVSELDSLIAMSKISTAYNLVRPTLLEAGNKLKIVGGWHILSDLLCQFVRNTTAFRGSERVVIITGPNASGKSVYLKQVGIIVLLALSGCFVPATSAQIPLFDKICTRIHAVESVSTGYSTFMIDLSQMSLAIRSSTKNSLIIVDEFGKGTSDVDGIAIVAATIQEFLDRGDNCPTFFLSTHLYSITKCLTESALLKYQTMKFIEENKTLTYLYELMDGQCKKSFATVLAMAKGVPTTAVKRITEIENVVGESNADVDARISSNQKQKMDLLLSVQEGFKNINFNEIDLVEYLKSVKATLHDFHNQEDHVCD